MNRSLWADFAHHFRLGLRTYFAPLRWLPVWLAILAATLATAPGCGSVAKPTPVVVAETAQRSVLVAYETHAATSRALLAALSTGAVNEAKAAELYAHLVAAKQSIDAAARLSALGQAAAAQADLRTAEVLLRVVAESLR